jgi:hypothetical protein
MRYFKGEEIGWRRVYSKDRIEKDLGEIPNDAKKLKLPGFVERFVGEFYEINQADKYSIEGNNLGLKILHMRDGADKAVREVSYSHIARAFKPSHS